MSDLFAAPEAARDGPLADRMRPRTLDDVVGQDHIVGPGRLLRRAIQADRLSSVLFYGPPGTGKTSLARVIANSTRGRFESLNAVLAGVKDIREAIDRAEERRGLYGTRTILFVDEVHRWNKAQQDALLPWVENGTVILVGATTENPFFEVNRALVSRSRIFQLKALTAADLLATARRALEDAERGYGRWRVAFEEKALEHLVEVASGDARSLLNALELAVETSPPAWPPEPGAVIPVSFQAAEESIQRRAVLYDRDGDYHFDTISAFIKSVRGSDPDAALYWLAKMVRAGEDPAFIFRRMIILASEDVGLADPTALGVVMSCAAAFDRIGFPEGNFPLAQAALYLATAPKSNSAMAFFDALAEVDREDQEVPQHLRDGNRDKESFGHGEGYVYPHAYRDHWTAQQYLPAALRGRTFYTPSEVAYEGRVRAEVLRKREIQAAVLLSAPEEEEILTWSAASKGREGWYKRLESGRGAVLTADRDAVFAALERGGPILRHERILALSADEGLLLWEGLRRAPEGLCAATVSSEAVRETLLRYAAGLEEMDQPAIAVFPAGQVPAPEDAAALLGSDRFDRLVGREPWRRAFDAQPPAPVFARFAAAARRLLVDGGSLALAQAPPRLGQRLSALLAPLPGGADLAARLAAAEEAFFAPSEEAADPGDPPGKWTWRGEDLAAALEAAGFRVRLDLQERREPRLITRRDLAAWFDREKSSWGRGIAARLGAEDFAALQRLLTERAAAGPFDWRWRTAVIHALAV